MQQRGSETRAQILRAAEKMFALHGYDGTGVAEICEAAGVSKGAFYHHFSSKHELFRTMLEDWLTGVNAQLKEIRGECQDVPQTLLAMSAMMNQVFQAAGGRLPIFLEFWAQASRDPKVWESTATPYHRYYDFFTSLIEDGIKEGTLKPVDSTVIARTIIALATGILLQGLLEPQAAEWDKITEQGLKYLMVGIAKENL
jgi:AcrR family transcriptional regulator